MSLYPSLDYFIAIAKHNNITKAANELYVSQQTLSIYLKKLEEYYQIQLFERYPKMCLTPAGEAVYEAALEIADAYSRVDEKLDKIKNVTHKIRLGICKAKIDNLLGYYPLARLKKSVGVDVEIIEKTSTELEKEALNGELDLYIGNEDVDQGIFETYHINTYPYYVFISPELFQNYVAERYGVDVETCAKGIDLQMLKEVPFIASQFGHLRTYVMEYEKKCGFKLDIVVENSNPNLRIQMAEYNIGFTISEEPVITYDKLYLFPIKQPDHKLSLGLVRRRMPVNSKYADDCWKYTIENIQEITRFGRF